MKIEIDLAIVAACIAEDPDKFVEFIDLIALAVYEMGGAGSPTDRYHEFLAKASRPPMSMTRALIDQMHARRYAGERT